MATLAQAYLTEAERRALDNLVSELRERLGEELVAVWLYGSRARGERTHDESDIDLLVIVESEDRVQHREPTRLLQTLAQETGERPYFFISAQLVDRAWIADRRSIGAFFIRDVDRDKVVVYGEEDGLRGEEIVPEPTQEGEVRRRSLEYLDRAEEELRAARRLSEADAASVAVSRAYFAMFNAGKAALSEIDQHARSHSGTWDRFKTAFVDTQRFDPELYALASRAQGKREHSDYKLQRFSEGEARELVEAAERFVAAVEAMLDADRQ